VDRELPHLWPSAKWRTIEQLVERGAIATEEAKYFTAVILSSFTMTTPIDVIIADITAALKPTGIVYNLTTLAMGLSNPYLNPERPTIVCRDQIAGTFSVIVYLSEPLLTNPTNETQYIDGNRAQRRPHEFSSRFLQFRGHARESDSHSGPKYARHYTATCIYEDRDIPLDSDLILLVAIGFGRNQIINFALTATIIQDLQDISEGKLRANQIKSAMELLIVNRKLDRQSGKEMHVRTNAYNMVFRVPITTPEDVIQKIHRTLNLRHGDSPVRIQHLGHQLAIATGINPHSLDQPLITTNQPSLQLANIPMTISQAQLARHIHSAVDIESCQIVLPWTFGTYVLLSSMGYSITEGVLRNTDFTPPTSNPMVAFINTHLRAQATFKADFTAK
jgi:hypothetical protein